MRDLVLPPGVQKEETLQAHMATRILKFHMLINCDRQASKLRRHQHPLFQMSYTLLSSARADHTGCVFMVFAFRT